MMRVDSGRLPFPEVQYRINSDFVDPDPKKKPSKDPKTGLPPPRHGSGWNIPDYQCFHLTPAKSLKYYLIHNSISDQRVASFENELKNQMMRRCKMASSDIRRVNTTIALSNEKTFESHLSDAKVSGADLVVLMLPKPDRSMYGNFKRLTDRTHGLNSICLAKPAAMDSQISKYMTNIALKVNFKTGGINAQVKGINTFMGNNTLLLGADVVHPGHLAFEESPSIACIVGSVDNEAGRFFGSARLQSKDKTDREVGNHSAQLIQD